MIEDRTVSIGLAEVLRPSIDMRVEMDQCRPIVPLCQRAKERQGNAMITTQRYKVLDVNGLLFDRHQAPGNIAQRDCEVANIGYGHGGGIDPMQRMVTIY